MGIKYGSTDAFAKAIGAHLMKPRIIAIASGIAVKELCREIEPYHLMLACGMITDWMITETVGVHSFGPLLAKIRGESFDESAEDGIRGLSTDSVLAVHRAVRNSLKYLDKTASTESLFAVLTTDRKCKPAWEEAAKGSKVEGVFGEQLLEVYEQQKLTAVGMRTIRSIEKIYDESDNTKCVCRLTPNGYLQMPDFPVTLKVHARNVISGVRVLRRIHVSPDSESITIDGLHDRDELEITVEVWNRADIVFTETKRIVAGPALPPHMRQNQEIVF